MIIYSIYSIVKKVCGPVLAEGKGPHGYIILKVRSYCVGRGGNSANEMPIRRPPAEKPLNLALSSKRTRGTTLCQQRSTLTNVQAVLRA